MDTNKKGKVLGSRNTIWRKAFAGMSEALSALKVKFDCREGKEGGMAFKCLQVTTVYLITNLEGDDDVETSIQNGRVLDPAWSDPVVLTPAAT